MAAQVIIYDLAGRLSVQGADVAARELGKVNKATKSVKEGFKSLGAVGGHLAHAATGVAAIGIGFAATLGKMAHSAMEFEQKMAYVGALVGGKHTDDFKAMEKAAREMGLTSYVSSTKAAEALYEIKKAGFSASESIAFLKPALALSTLENIKVEESAGIAASAIRGFGLEAKRSGEVVDAMAFVSKNTAAGIKNLGDGMRYSSTTARHLGMDYKDVLLYLGLLNNANMKGSVAGTTLNSMLLRLSGASTRGSKSLKQLGIDMTYAKDTTDEFRVGHGKGATKSAVTLIYEMGKKYKELSEKAGVGQVGATKVFMRSLGQVGGKAVAASFEATAYPEMMKRLKELYDEKHLKGFAEMLAARRFESTLGTVEKMKNAFSSLSIELSKSNLFGGFFSDKLNKMLGVMRLAAAAAGGYQSAGRDTIMQVFGISEGTAAKVEKVVAGIKRGISESMSFVEKMYRKAAEFLKKNGGAGDIEQIAATATKAFIAIAAAGPAIFALAPAIWATTGAVKALMSAGGALSGPGGWILALTAGVTALEGKFSDTGGKSKGFFESLIAGFRDSNSVAGALLGSIKDIAHELGPVGSLLAFVGLRGSTNAIGKALVAASSVVPGAAGAVAGAAGASLIQALPVKVVAWTAGPIPGGLGGNLLSSAVPGAAGAASGIGGAAGAGGLTMVLGTVGSIVIGGTVGVIAGHALDNKFGLSDKMSSQGLFSSLQGLMPFLPGGPMLAAAGAPFGEGFHKWAPEMDKMFGTTGKTDEENDARATVWRQNERLKRATEEFDTVVAAYKSGQKTYGGEMITSDFVRRKLAEGLKGSSASDNADYLAEQWTAQHASMLPVGSGGNVALTELEKLNQQIATLEATKDFTGMTPEIQRQREQEIADLSAQQQKIAEILKEMRGENKTFRLDNYIMLDGKQIGSSTREIELSNAARSGVQAGGPSASSMTSEPMMSE